MTEPKGSRSSQRTRAQIELDAGFLQAGYLDASGERVLMVLSAPDAEEVANRLDDLPIVHDGSVSFSVAHVTALRFS